MIDERKGEWARKLQKRKEQEIKNFQGRKRKENKTKILPSIEKVQKVDKCKKENKKIKTKAYFKTPIS